MKNILILGGAGFVGKNIIDYLLKKDNECKIGIFDNLSSGSFEKVRKLKPFQEERIQLIEGDIKNREKLHNYIKDYNNVINLAAQVSVTSSKENPLHDARNNILGLINILEACKEENVEKVIQASSVAPFAKKNPVSEKSVPRPLSPYGASKLACEAYCSAYANSFGLESVVLRFPNVYGPYSENSSGVIQKFIRRILRNEKLEVFGDGEQTRDYIYARDIAEGIYLSLTEDLKDNFEIIQLGTGNEASVKEIIEILREVANLFEIEFPEVIYEEERKGEIKRSYTDITKGRKLLGFEPSIDLKEGIKKTFKWYLEHKNFKEKK